MNAAGADLGWLFHYTSLTVELTRLLGIKFAPGEKHYFSPIGASLASVIKFHNQGRHDYRECELLELAFLVDNLRHIKQYDHDLFAYFRRELLRHASMDMYYGIRFEISTCASLIKKRIDFESGKKDFPDFSVRHLDEEISLECVSVHFKNERTGKILRKVRQAVTKKSKQVIDKSRTVILIDITNLCWSLMRNGPRPDMVDPLHAVQDVVMESGVGSIIAFTYYVEWTSRQFRTGYNRADGPAPAHALTAFLNYYYPKGDIKSESFLVPPHG